MSVFDAMVHSLQNIPSFNIHFINENGTTSPWWEITGEFIMKEVLINENALQEEVQCISGKVAHWGRYYSQCQRVAEIKEREYRIWRSGKYLEFRKEKSHTEKEVDALIRTDPMYSHYYREHERAVEAANSMKLIVDALLVKKNILQTMVYRRNTEDGAPLSI